MVPCVLVCRKDQEQLQERLKTIERKVIVGGVDLLKKAEEQEKLLEVSNTELQERKQQQEELRKQIQDKEVGAAGGLHSCVSLTMS